MYSLIYSVSVYWAYGVFALLFMLEYEAEWEPQGMHGVVETLAREISNWRPGATVMKDKCRENRSMSRRREIEQVPQRRVLLCWALKEAFTRWSQRGGYSRQREENVQRHRVIKQCVLFKHFHHQNCWSLRCWRDCPYSGHPWTVERDICMHTSIDHLCVKILRQWGETYGCQVISEAAWNSTVSIDSFGVGIGSISYSFFKILYIF